MEENKKYAIRNRSAGMVYYTIPEAGIQREFYPGEEKVVTFKELLQLSYQPGGREIMSEFLQLKAIEATEALNIKRELEYDMSEEDIVKMLRYESNDKLLDALDFAPVGVIDLIKKLAVSIPLTDLNKCRSIKEKTGFDVLAAVMHENEVKEQSAEPEPETKTRRVVEEPIAAPTRRVSTSKKTLIDPSELGIEAEEEA